MFARLAAEAALGGLAPVTLLALLKHARFRLGAAAGAHARAIAALELAVLRGPRPRPGAAGLAQALATLPRRETLHRVRSAQEARGRRSRCRAGAGRAARRGARAARRRCARSRSPRSPRCMRDVLSRAVARRRRQRSRHSPATTATTLARGLRGDRRAAATTSAVAPGDYADLFETAIADRACRRAETPGARVRILGPLEARLSASIAWCSAGWSKASGRRRRAPIRGCRGRCGSSSGSTCRSGASGCRRTTSRSCSALPEVILTRAAKLGGAPTVASRFVQRLAAVAGETRWKARARARREISRLGARSRSRREASRRRRGRARAAARRAAERPERHRDRGLAARSLHDLRQAHSGAPPARCGRHAARRARPRHRDPRRDRRLHRDVRQGLPADPLARAARARRDAFRAAAGLSGGARVLVAALRAHRALVRRLGSAAARRARRALHAEVRAKLDDPDRHAQLRAARARRPHRAAAPTAATRSSTTRPARRRPSKQVRTGLSPQLTLEGAILRAGGFEGIAPARLDRRARLCGAARRRAARASRSRSSSRRARRTVTPTARSRRLKGVARALRATRTSPIARWSARCGRRATATTTIWRA